MWEHHNSALHNSPAAQQNIVESRVNDAIWALYAKGSWILPQDAMHFMAQLVKYQLSLPLVAKQQWLETVELARA